jgi:hypothetical protein
MGVCCSVDNVLEEKGLKKNNEEGIKMYEEYIKHRKIFIYNTVNVIYCVSFHNQRDHCKQWWY